MKKLSARPDVALPMVSSAGVPPAQYNAVVDKAELASVNLHRLAMTTAALVSEEPRSLSFGSGEIVDFAHGEDVAVASVRFTAEVIVGDVKEFSVDATYVVIYSGVRGLSEPAVHLFCKRVGIVAAYPYFRAMVAQLSWASATPLPPLPVIRGSRSIGESELPPPPTDPSSQSLGGKRETRSSKTRRKKIVPAR